MKKLTLNTPVSKGERTISELKFSDAKVRHMTAIDGFEDKNGYGADLALASSLTGEPVSILGEVEPEDWVKVREILTEVYARFMGLSLEELQEASDPPAQPEDSEASGESSTKP